MAAPCRNVGHCIRKNGRILFNNLEQRLGNRSFGGSCTLQQQAAEAQKESTEAIVIPKKKTWSNVAVLEALASTVGWDSTAYPYQFQDDPYLSPRTNAEFKMYTLSQESGSAAAKYFINNNPKFFSKDFAEPHIPCLMPETVSLRLEEVSEEALKERISLRKVTAAVDMYDQLLQAGTAVSMETVHSLLDLVSLYCDKEPDQDGEPQQDNAEAGEQQRRTWNVRRVNDILKLTWKENSSAERIFNLLPEKDTRCYSALIRGMVKHRAYAKAFSMYTDLLNNRLTADVHIFNALIMAAPYIHETFTERWELITDLLNQMNQQKLRPNLLTFNNTLRALCRCGPLAKTQALNVLNEMKALSIAPSPATFESILRIFHRSGSSLQNKSSMLHEVMAELEGTSLTFSDPTDVKFFWTAMKICFENKDLDLAYEVQRLVEVGENWRLLGDSYHRSIYFFNFLSLLCMTEHLDVVMKWYKRIVPSLYYPIPQSLKDLMQALDTENRLDLLPDIWKDIKFLGHDNKPDLVGELLSLMARDQHSPEVQASFAVCALEVKAVMDVKFVVQWSASSLSNITMLLLRADRSLQAWEMLQQFKSMKRVPSEQLLRTFLTVCRRDATPQKAVELVQLSASFCLPSTPSLAKQTLEEFHLSEEQRAILSELESTGETLTQQEDTN